MRILGLDPGLRKSGWGIIDARGGHLAHVADGTVRSADDGALADRLAELYYGIGAVIAEHAPDAAAAEETFINRNPASTLKLGQARGVVLLAPATAGLSVTEYAATTVKKAVVGSGGAAKKQVGMMVGTLLPGATRAGEDATDALAVAICHAHMQGTRAAWAAREVAP